LISRRRPINIEEFTYDKSIIDKYQAFQKDYLRLKDNPEEAKRYLFSRYGDTYWYYLKFPRPVAEKRSIEVKETERE
jgi:hypothetical protein